MTDQQSSKNKVPILGEGFQESTTKPMPKSPESSDTETTSDAGAKSGKRRLFGFGKKKDAEKEKTKKQGNSTVPFAKPTTQERPLHTGSPSRPNHPYRNPSSPTSRNVHSSSPRVVSPAGSQIFERDVQENAVPVPASPAIPSHIQTENHIPSVLDASSEAITNKQLDPDSVEIVMHTSHQPAAVTVSGLGNSDIAGSNWADDLGTHPDKEDAASNYGALDSADVRRLSFISFADVVQSEHAEHVGSRESFHAAGLSSLSSSGLNRSPSPVRSPVSSQGFSTSPPTSKEASVKGIELSPVRKPSGLASPASLTSGGELTIETMTQALRRTGSGDFSGVRSLPLSPASNDAMSDSPFK
ncbi:hypothetical protein PVAG01_03506 [Phlyctema vagabunda]|uniref:Uncharacterized protein n=1 Tax=Phlyctema vagabunda TaxID=108571 RepID=A0ABR4PLL1_9HELO